MPKKQSIGSELTSNSNQKPLQLPENTIPRPSALRAQQKLNFGDTFDVNPIQNNENNFPTFKNDDFNNRVNSFNSTANFGGNYNSLMNSNQPLSQTTKLQLPSKDISNPKPNFTILPTSSLQQKQEVSSFENPPKFKIEKESPFGTQNYDLYGSSHQSQQKPEFQEQKKKPEFPPQISKPPLVKQSSIKQNSDKKKDQLLESFGNEEFGDSTGCIDYKPWDKPMERKGRNKSNHEKQPEVNEHDNQIATATGVEDNPVKEYVEEEEALIECPEGCGRKFKEDALAKHITVCKKVFLNKRKEFNSQQHRLADEEQAKLIKQAKIKEKKNQIQLKTKKSTTQEKKDWKAQSEAFRQQIKQQVSEKPKEEAKRGEIQIVSKPPKSKKP